MTADSMMTDPASKFGEIFSIVQLRRLFSDGKYFPDMEPRYPPEDIVAAWREASLETNDEIIAFVQNHFLPPHISDEVPEEGSQNIDDHVTTMWDRLVRPATRPDQHSSAIWLPNPYVVPGGRFRECYYWDSYFTMLGLRVDGRLNLVEGMIDNFVSLIERFGHVPNGTRSYFLSRSQPPFLAQMIDLSDNNDPIVRSRRLHALKSEHAYWMRGNMTGTQMQDCEHVVAMPDGSTLNRFWDEKSTPRPESFAEDITTALASGRPVEDVYRDLRAGAESGWDFSSRWLADGRTLPSIETTAIVPCDLNSLLFATENKIAEECRAVGVGNDAAVYEEASRRRIQCMNSYLWDPAEGRFADWHTPSATRRAGLTAATLYPLYVGLASAEQAKIVAQTVRDCLLAPGGLRTTLATTGEQWDAPNGWAPLQWIATQGLRRYGECRLAAEVSERWIATVEHGFKETGMIFEKYDVETRHPAGGGEYPNQVGFGWTNGVLKALKAGSPSVQG